jgi:hypothetical protein
VKSRQFDLKSSKVRIFSMTGPSLTIQHSLESHKSMHFGLNGSMKHLLSRSVRAYFMIYDQFIELYFPDARYDREAQSFTPVSDWRLYFSRIR